MSGPRKWAMVVLAHMFTMISGEKFTDATSGFQAADRKAIEQYCEHLPAEYLGDCIDACVMAIRSGLTVRQVPVEMRERGVVLLLRARGSLRCTWFVLSSRLACR